MTRTGHWRSTLARRSRPWALALSCLLLAAQWVLFTHHHAEHADEQAPASHASHACDLCVAFAAAAPAPAAATSLSLPRGVTPQPQPATGPVLAQRRGGAHRSRAPPSVHSA
jgi:hypothetical protein